MSDRLHAAVVALLTIVIFVAVNIAADTLLTGARLDLTENRQFTLAQGTRNIVHGLREPIKLRFFFSKQVAADYAQTNAYAGRVRDMLREFAAISGGKIELEEIDPEPYTPEEDEAAADGLNAAPTDSGEQVYFGLVGTNRIDGKETIGYFSPDREPFLEYDLASLIYRLANPKRPGVTIISSLPLDTGAGGMAAALQGQAQPFAIYQELSTAYRTQMLDAGFGQIPSDTDVLVLVHPPPLSSAQLDAIDQFVLGGGRALIFVDPNSEIAQASAGIQQQSTAQATSDLAPLLASWGVAYDSGKVVADRARAQRVQISNDPRNSVASYPLWLHLTMSDFASSDPVTANLQTLNLASAGVLRPLRTAGIRFAPLVSSSDEASLLDATQVRFNPSPQDLLGSLHATGNRYAIAARLSGTAASAFPQGTGAGAGTMQTSGHVSTAAQRHSSGRINVIVMADSDIFDDRFWVRVESVFGRRIAAPFADNAAFVLNAVENLTGSGDLISLRTRATNDRPFTVVRNLQAAAQAQFQQEAEMLQERLTDTQKRLHDLEQGGSTNGTTVTSTALTGEQQAAIIRFKRQLVETRTQLRDVQHSLRKNIDTLGEVLAFINIALVPLILTVLAVPASALRRRRRARPQSIAEGKSYG
ncbi:MAG: Gldg family protein [Alphaproteobacteria bacterium]|nr:Gldg family protein [Alphaproteobacteria bacterium]